MIKNITPKWVTSFVFIFLVFMLYVLYTNLGRDALFDWDEGIYATLGRELIHTREIFVTYWNGATWFEKPPGIAWLSALGQVIGGQRALGARLFQPVVTVAVLFGVFRLGTVIASWSVGISAMGLLATFNLFLGRARAVNADMPLLLGIVVTTYLLVTKKAPWKVALAVALSIWFKGIAGLLALIISAPLFISKSKKYVINTSLFIILFVLPWHAFAYWQYGEEFLTPYLREQVMTRIATPIEFHAESRWFYFQYLYENLGLGVVLVGLMGMVSALIHAWRQKSFIYLLPVWWLAVPLAIFTIAKTRLFWYILPVYPAIAILCGIALWQVSGKSKMSVVLTIIAIGICAQGLLSAWRSVEPERKVAPMSDRLQLVSNLAKFNSQELLVLVPHTERVAEAILPSSQRISSSFRYGGMPSVVYYFGGQVKYFYNVDQYKEAWNSRSTGLSLITKKDLGSLPTDYRIIEEQGEYLTIGKGSYVNR